MAWEILPQESGGGGGGFVDSVADTASLSLVVNSGELTGNVIPGGISHNSLADLTVGDVHTQYAYLSGRAGGQTLIGGSAASNNLNLQATSHATKGSIFLNADRLGVTNSSANASFIGGISPQSSFASANDGESASATFSGTNAYLFLVSLSSGEHLVCSANFLDDVISAPSDPSGIFLLSDAGTGIYLSKSASSAVITVKNRMGVATDIGVQSFGSHLVSITAWA